MKLNRQIASRPQVVKGAPPPHQLLKATPLSKKVRKSYGAPAEVPASGPQMLIVRTVLWLQGPLPSALHVQ